MDAKINLKLADPATVAEWIAKSESFHIAQRNPNTKRDPIPTHICDGCVFHGHGRQSDDDNRP